MVAGEVDSWLGYQGDKLGNEVQWFEYHMGGAIAVGCFEFVAHLAVPGQGQAFGGYRWGIQPSRQV